MRATTEKHSKGFLQRKQKWLQMLEEQYLYWQTRDRLHKLYKGVKKLDNQAIDE